ncbi:outer membrane-stress sensor serine endopeptidase DegS [Celerinatantimonas sp. YJH-8]|uniref:outer membrane-stress sensor serine endopeptidase DegS n=1 Tax=Celerinatantimonas sp. YJH-8 TaxID=3228714 RepID=UPI0038CB2177
MIKYVLKAVGLGLAFAVVFLLIFPSLQSGHSLIPLRTSENSKLISFAEAARRASPAVVNIYTRSFSSSHLNESRPTVTSEGLGSGVIMNPQGYILTNMHVIADADQIVVALQDGRVFSAELIGSDLITDLAVLKIEAQDPLPVIPQDNHLQTRVGDVVLAIGNPYNVGQTVTQGIISATGRSGMSATGRQDFIQTDAAINRGNSGGALVNSLGELVGINTASYHLGQNSETYGISFAIPYTLAQRIMKSLIRYGRVIRGYMGVEATDITPQLAQHAGLGVDHGLRVDKVDPQGPASAAGLQAHDIILKINGKSVNSIRSTMDLVAETAPGTKVDVDILRAGKPQVLHMTVGELKIRRPR